MWKLVAQARHCLHFQVQVASSWARLLSHLSCSFLINKIHAATMENSMVLPQNLKIELPYNPEIPFLGIYPKKTETLIQKNTCIPVFIAA